MRGLPSGRERFLDPVIDAPFEHRERQLAAGEYRVVERANIEAIAQGFLGPGTQLLDLDHTDFVGRRLAWQHDITPNFRLHARKRFSRVLHHEVDGFLLGPALAVQARVDDQP